MGILKCPVCQTPYKEGQAYCHVCAWELESSTILLGVLSPEEQQAQEQRLALAKQNWDRMQHNNRPHSTTDEHKQFTEPYHIKKSSKEVSKTFRNVEYTVPLNDYHAKNWKLIRDLPLIETITITLSHKPASWSAVSRTKLNSGEYYTLMFESHDGYWDFAPCTIRIDQLIVMHAHGWLNQLSTQFRTSYITHGFSVFAFDWEGSGGPLAIKGEGFLDVTSPVLGRDIAHPDSKIVVKIREGLP